MNNTNYTNTAKLMYHMELKRLNKTRLALAAQISRNTITSIFKGKDVSMRVVHRVAVALDLSAIETAEIFFDEKLRNT